MSKIVKPVALDETLQTTNSKLDSIKSGIDSKAGEIKNAIATQTNTLETALGNTQGLGKQINDSAARLQSSVDQMKSTLDTDIKATNTAIDGMKSTLDTDIKATNTAIDQHKTATQTGLEVLTNELIGVLASVKSINGKYGVVVLDSGDILISRTTQGSKTVKQMIEEMQATIAKTPLTFGATQIEGDDYTLTITQGTPA